MLGSLTFGTHLSSPSCPRKQASRAVDLAAAALGPPLSRGDEEGCGGHRSGYFMAPVMKIANLTGERKARRTVAPLGGA